MHRGTPVLPRSEESGLTIIRIRVGEQHHGRVAPSKAGSPAELRSQDRCRAHQNPSDRPDQIEIRRTVGPGKRDPRLRRGIGNHRTQLPGDGNSSDPQQSVRAIQALGDALTTARTPLLMHKVHSRRRKRPGKGDGFATLMTFMTGPEASPARARIPGSGWSWRSGSGGGRAS